MRTVEVFGGCVSIRFCVMGPIRNNVYLIDDQAGGTIVVDPHAAAPTIVDLAGKAPVSAIFITHCHFDHVAAAAQLRRLTGASLYASALDADCIERGQQPGESPIAVPPCPVDRKLQDGDYIHVGNTTWQALLTPGHTKGSLCYLCKAPDCQGAGADAGVDVDAGVGAGAPVLLAGDTLFEGGIGRTDFEGGSMADMRLSLRKLSELSDETLVLPGHGATTCIHAERVRVIEALK